MRIRTRKPAGACFAGGPDWVVGVTCDLDVGGVRTITSAPPGGAAYREANRFNHETKRPRRLLLHRREIDKLAQGVLREGLTIVPLKVFFNPRGRAKVDIALARGKRAHDKREAQKERSWQRDRQRLLRERG